MAITLLGLRERAQVLSDLKGTDFLTSTEWLPLINDGICAVYSEVISVCNTFKVSTSTFTISSTATPSSALPADFRAVFAVLRDPALSTETRLNRYGARSAGQMTTRSYRIEGRNLIIEPRERSIGSYRLDYNPIPPELAIDADALDVELEQFEDAICLHACVAAMASDQRDISQHAAQLGAAMDRLRSWASLQRSADPDTIEDVRYYGTPSFWSDPP